MYIWSSSAKEAEEFSMALQTLFSFFSFICSAVLNLTLRFIAQKDKSAMVKWKLHAGQKHL